MLVPILVSVITLLVMAILYLIYKKNPTVYCPELKCPNIEIPEMNCPEIKCPDVKCPEGKCPEVKCPEMKCPEMKCPEVKCPDPSTCTLTTYAFKHHFFKLLTGPRKAFAMKIIDSIHEVQTTTQNKYIIPLLEDTLDINLQLILEGIDWDFLNNIVDNVKECILTFLKTNDTIKNNTNNTATCIRKTFVSINREKIYDIYLQIHKNLRKNYQDIKFVKYEKMPANIQKQGSKDEYLDSMNRVRKNIKKLADKEFIPESEFYNGMNLNSN